MDVLNFEMEEFERHMDLKTSSATFKITEAGIIDAFRGCEDPFSIELDTLAFKINSEGIGDISIKFCGEPDVETGAL